MKSCSTVSLENVARPSFLSGVNAGEIGFTDGDIPQHHFLLDMSYPKTNLAEMEATPRPVLQADHFCRIA